MVNHRHLLVDYETYDLVKDCINEFLKLHPEFKGMKITQDFIIKKIAEFYLEND